MQYDLIGHRGNGRRKTRKLLDRHFGCRAFGCRAKRTLEITGVYNLNIDSIEFFSVYFNHNLIQYRVVLTISILLLDLTPRTSFLAEGADRPYVLFCLHHANTSGINITTMRKLFSHLPFKIALGPAALCVGMLCDPAFASDRPLRFIYLQGFLSCTVSNLAPVSYFMKIAKDHPDAKLYYGCFDAGFAQHPSDLTERFYLYTRTPSGPWSAPELLDAQSAPLAISLKLRHDVQELIAQYPDDAPSTPQMNIVIAGHSHGAWLAMHTAYQVALNPQMKLKDLLTIDPVSYVDCPSSKFPWHVLSATFGWFADYTSCHGAPKDLEGIEQTIAEAANFHWNNFYETSMPYLSSGPVRHATGNFEFTSPSYVAWLTAHRAILKDPKTWERFYRRLTHIVQDAENDHN